jgi:flagellar protein FlgJ
MADGSNSFNLFGIKAGAELEGRHADVVTTEYVDGQAAERAARSAPTPATRSRSPTTRADEDSPRYRTRGGCAGATSARTLRPRPAARRLRHRPGLCRQARRVINTTLRLQRSLAVKG